MSGPETGRIELIVSAGDVKPKLSTKTNHFYSEWAVYFFVAAHREACIWRSASRISRRNAQVWTAAH